MPGKNKRKRQEKGGDDGPATKARRLHSADGSLATAEHTKKDAWNLKETFGQNAKFEAYYRGRVVPEADWDEFHKAMNRQLPACFRISTIGGQYGHLKDILDGDCFGLPREPKQVVVDGETCTYTAPRPLPWYTPFGHAYQIELGKRQLRKVTELRVFRNFLMREDRQGNITRQEAVSMIPPQLLDVQPHHAVLDMCAAPGSKTAQLLEALHSAGPSVVPTGMIIANDADPKRAYMLVHQLKRLGSPSFLVTTHQGQFFPSIYRPKAGCTPDPMTGVCETEPLYFDRVLCDVPCSGDGTIRKSPNIWNKWNFSGGIGLHALQLQIAWRAAQMLAVDGKMVYSTCSLNPIENEAVVAELIRRSKGALEIVDVSDKLPGLIREKGLTEWEFLLEDNAEEKNVGKRKGKHGAKKKGDGPRGYEDAIPLEGEKEVEAVKQGDDQSVAPAKDGEDSKAESTNETTTNAETMADNSNTTMRDRPPQNFATIKTSVGPVNVVRVTSLADVDALPISRQKKVKYSYFCPKVLATFKEDAMKQVEATTSETFQSQIATIALKQTSNPSAGEMGLERCIRVLPHKQDTGGFFITLLRKVKPLPSWTAVEGEAEGAGETESKAEGETGSKVEAKAEDGNDNATTITSSPTATSSSESTSTTDNSKRTGKGKRDKQTIFNDFPFRRLNNEQCEQLERAYGLDQRLGYKREFMFTRSEEPNGWGNRVYYLSEAAGQMITCERNWRLKVVHSGLKIFDITNRNAINRLQKSVEQGVLHKAGVLMTEDNNTSNNDTDTNNNTPTPTAVVTTSTSDNPGNNRLFRIVHEALNFVVPYMKRQVIRVTLSDIKTLLLVKTQGMRHSDLSLILQAQIAVRGNTSLSLEKVTKDAAEAGVDISKYLSLGEPATNEDVLRQKEASEREVKERQDRHHQWVVKSSSPSVTSSSTEVTPSPLLVCERGPLDLGSIVLEVPLEDLPPGSINRFLCPAWLTYNNISIMVPEEDRQAIVEWIDPSSVQITDDVGGDGGENDQEAGDEATAPDMQD